MAKTPVDRASDSARVFGGPGRTQRTEKFDPSNPIHEGIARLRDEAHASHQPNPNPNSHITYKSGGSITIPLPGDYSEKNLPKPREKKTRLHEKTEEAVQVEAPKTVEIPAAPASGPQKPAKKKSNLQIAQERLDQAKREGKI